MITLKDAILLLGAVSIVRSFSVDLKKCPKRHGFFPKPGSLCKAYYRCSNWIPVEEVCPWDQIFNPIAGWCDWNDAFPCLDKPKRKECPRDDGRFLKPGTDCKVYYDCCNGEPTEKKCPRDQLFDPNKERCEWFELYTCVEQPKRKECPKENGRFLKPDTECKRYYDCRYGEPTERECPKDQLFDPSVGRCEWIELYTCVEKPKQNVCLKENGRFLKPRTNCKRYYDCRQGIPTERECPSDELFNPSTESCEWSELYNCVEDLSTNIPTVNTISTIFKTSTYSTTDNNQNFKTSDGISPTSSEPRTRSSPSVLGSSSTYSSTSGSSDYDPTSASSTSSYPNTRSSPGVPESSSTYSSTSGSSDYDPTSASSTSSYPNTRSSPGVFESSSTHSSTLGSSDYEPPSRPYLSSSSYTASQSNIQTSTRVMSTTASDLTSTTIINIMCPEPFGYFPHPTDKHKFVGCVDNVPNVLTCPSNLVYNHKIRQCDYE